MNKIRDPKWIHGPEENKDPLMEEIEWDVDFEPNPEPDFKIFESQTEWDALDDYERNLDRNY